jgi:hypothetical protein
MSHRPINTKKANRVRKLMRRQLPAYIDLVAWLKQHGYADTTGEAHKIILARRVKSESHVIGLTKGKVPKDNARIKVLLGRQLTEDDFEDQDVVLRNVPARVRGTITVSA